jgi:divalent metal cation (Fe/Co/Zn/Cd) transporter
MAERIVSAISRVPGVLRNECIHVRQRGQHLFVELLLTLESNISFEHAQSVKGRMNGVAGGPLRAEH